MTATTQNKGAEINPYPKHQAGKRWNKPMAVSYLAACKSPCRTQGTARVTQADRPQHVP